MNKTISEALRCHLYAQQWTTLVFQSTMICRSHLLVQACPPPAQYADPEHTFLVFLPGSALIREFHTKLHTTFGAELDLHTLHSTVPIEDQQRVMLPSDPGRRKVWSVPIDV